MKVKETREWFVRGLPEKGPDKRAEVLFYFSDRKDPWIIMGVDWAENLHKDLGEAILEAGGTIAEG